MQYLLLILAIGAELAGTIFLKFTDGFTKLYPTIITLMAYGTAFYSLSIVVKTLPVNVVYAIWSGAGIVLVTLISVFIFHNTINCPTMIGTALIVVGVVLVNTFGAGH
ncbi:multidrug efflux SMR transporter [Weissella coleopterorum]|uniref:Multidrug efflux SMR transporter n=1 Tax=Weissella coleopterorum TaxID=2714949 RepID=A0A6G8AZ46_9LACO|nr:multidrug efflux SMR transporter [Weissella coleopterorum]QIL50153.1 multidrug efflux SMR transporter [Weissella coleopterorum]